MPTQLSSDSIQMLVTSMTKGERALSEIEVERFLNALARAQSGVPTGVPTNVEPKEQSHLT